MERSLGLSLSVWVCVSVTLQQVYRLKYFSDYLYTLIKTKPSVQLV